MSTPSSFKNDVCAIAEARAHSDGRHKARPKNLKNLKKI